MLERFIEDPFGYLDRIELRYKWFNLNIFQKYQLNRRIAFILACISLIAWIVLGFDSTIGQLIHPLYNLPQLASGQITFQEWVDIFHNQYGREMHWSAFVIYGFMFWGLSHYYEKRLGIIGSLNITYSASVMFLSIALFEFYWMLCYGVFQHQPWVITPKWPQLRIHLQNLAFLLVGLMGFLYMWADSHIFNKAGDVIGKVYEFRSDLLLVILVILSGWSAFLWVNYPGPVQPVGVTYETGEMWHNTHFFPQTLYTIDVNPHDDVNAGVWFYHEDNLIHGLNTLVKALWTLTIAYVGLVVPITKSKYEVE